MTSLTKVKHIDKAEVETYLKTVDHDFEIAYGPHADMSHAEITVVVDVRISVDLVHLVIHETLADQRMGPGHVFRRVLVWIEATLKRNQLC